MYVKCRPSTAIILFLAIHFVDGLNTNEPNACPKYVRRKKANGHFHRVLEMTCCPNYMEVDNKCVACSGGTFGTGCLQRCTCSPNSACNKITGHCECHRGYQGAKCEEHCPYHFYGDNCLHRCSCPNRVPCHHEDGSCLCPKGFSGPRCDETCEPGTYGHSCTNKCSCPEKSTCDSTNGHCRCDSGWTGTYCNNTCSTGTYGVDCVQTCSKCSNCDPATGACNEMSTGVPYGSIGFIVGCVLGFMVLITSVLFLYLKYHHSILKAKHLNSKPKDERSSNHSEEIDDYREIADDQLFPPYNYV